MPRMLLWNGHQFATVKDVEKAVALHVMNTLKGPVPHPNDLTVVMKDPIKKDGERERYEVKVAVMVEHVK